MEYTRSAPTSTPVFTHALAGVSNLALRKKAGVESENTQGPEAGGALAKSSDKRVRGAFQVLPGHAHEPD